MSNKIRRIPDDFKKIKEKGEEFYKSIDDVSCPYLNKKVSFNSRGLEHLKFKGRNKTRTPQDQHMRFKLISIAPEILRSSHTLQGVWETKKFEKVRTNSRNDMVLKPVNYYEFIAVVKRNRVKVIVKQIDGGEIFFWSLIPFWGTNEEYRERILHDGEPEED
jgi:hypothetical protein